MKRSHLTPETATALIAACVFFSGLCALIYQTTWLREFRLIFGASTAASASVLAIFMGGLGAGSVVLGRRADGVRNPFRFYAQLELLISLTAVLTPWLLALARQIYIALGGTLALGTALGTGLRLVLASLVLLAPTFLMGGTLPAVARAVPAAGDLRRRQVALLYALNTFGAVTGALVATFILFERLGNRMSLWSAAAVNIAVGLMAWTISRVVAEPLEEAAPPAARAPGKHTAIGTPVQTPAAPAMFVLSAAAVVGFAFFLMELVWYRMLNPVLGGSTFTFGLILAVALGGIALGSLAYHWRGTGVPVTLRGFALVCATEALCVMVPYATGDRLALLALLLQPLGSVSFALRAITWIVVTAIVVLPAAVVAGIQFPMLIALLGRGHRQVGTHTGLVYGWNTAGAIAGSIAGGFGLLSALTAPGAWLTVAAVLVLLSTAALVVSFRNDRRVRPLLGPMAVAAAAVALTTATGPTAAWRHTAIGAGRLHPQMSSQNELQDFLRQRRRRILWEAEGIESSVGMSFDNGLAFLVNGKMDGNARGDAGTQVMAGLMGALFHPHPTRALVVGLGTGSTAGWLARVPTVERVDVVELEPAVIHVAKACSVVNENALTNPKLRVIFGDAREILLTTAEQYDLIFSEPSNPYRAGIASLYTREFYLAVAQRLPEAGVFAQWIQSYEVDGQSISTVYATLASVFPQVETWQTQGGDLLFICAKRPLLHDVPALRQRIQEEPYRRALAQVWRVTDLEGVYARYVANNGLARAVQATDPPLNTDDRTCLEFALAKTVGRAAGLDPDALRKVARQRGDHRPSLTGGELDWQKVQDRVTSVGIVNEKIREPDPAGPADYQSRSAAKIAFARGDVETAWTSWRQQTQAPGDLVELLLVAECLAASGDPIAPRYIRQLQEWLPGEAAGLNSHFLYCSHQNEAAVKALEEALVFCQRDPWIATSVVESSLKIATKIALAPGHRDFAVRLHQLLEHPFAVHTHDGLRLQTRLEIAGQLDAAGYSNFTRSVLEMMEPNVPWQEGLLQIRADCYRQLGDPRTLLAARELQRFKADTSRPFTYAGGQPPVPVTPPLPTMVPGLGGSNVTPLSGTMPTNRGPVVDP